MTVVTKKKTILVAVDGSIYSSHTLRYLADLFAAQQDIEIHLLHVSPAGELSAEREGLDELSLLAALGPAARKRYCTGKTCLDDAVAKLGRQGMPAGQIAVKLQIARQNVAAEIVASARSGLYDALVIGRRGLGKIEEIFMGSISQTILDTCHDVPLWIVDGEVKAEKFLVPVDGSYQSFMAVDHLAYMIGGNPRAEVSLFHSSSMFASESQTGFSELVARWGAEWCEQYLSGPDYLYAGPRQILLENGLPAERIHWLHTFKGFDPSRQIIRQALIDDFGTIVMGRRGGEIKKGIFKGVTDRVLFMAEKVAIWVVG